MRETEPLPAGLWCAYRRAADLLAGGQGDAEGAGDLQHIPGVLGFAEGAQPGVAAVDFVAGHPRRAAPLGQDLFDD